MPTNWKQSLMSYFSIWTWDTRTQPKNGSTEVNRVMPKMKNIWPSQPIIWHRPVSYTHLDVYKRQAVINPVKLIITNYPEGQVEELEAINNPEDPEAGSHLIEFSRELWMEREDFMEDAPKKYFRMTPGQEVRLKNAYIVKCTGCKKDENGVITEVYCEYDANTRSGMPDANRKVKGTLHWVSCNHCLQAEVRLYDRLWKVENPRDELAAIREAKNCEALEAMKEIINPDSLKVLPNCYIEKFAATLPTLSYLQFQRIGYFNIDKESSPEKLIFNRTVGLKDTWGKINK